jgi:hypothetical protein
MPVRHLSKEVRFKIIYWKLGVVVHTCNSMLRQEDQEFKAMEEDGGNKLPGAR